MPNSPLTRTLNVTTAREQFSQLLNQVFRRDHRVIIEKQGIPVAAIISAEDAQRLAEFERQHAEDFAFFDEIRSRFDDVQLEDHEREVARAVEEARRALPAGREAKATTPDSA